MKGFWFAIRNNMLEQKHVLNMGAAVWLLMWLEDHVTSVNEEGTGLVLRGKPVKYEEVAIDLGISQDTYTRWVEKLLGYPYIEKKTAPYGSIFRVYKSGKRNRMNAARLRKSATSFREGAERNKTTQDNIDNTYTPAADAASGKEVNEFIDLFQHITPTHARLFRMPPQRTAAERLLKIHPLTWWTMFMKAYGAKMSSDPYCPKISTPGQLEAKLGVIMAYGTSLKVKEAGKDKGRGFA